MSSFKKIKKITPVFVLNPYYTGIGIGRNLFSHGVNVYGLFSDKKAPGVKSRFFSDIYQVPDSRDEPTALYHKLVEIRKLYKVKPVIFPTRDFDVLFLHNFHKELVQYYHIPQPDDESIVNLMDKAALARIAANLQVPVPKTILCSSMPEVECSSLKFPVVMKPRSAFEWRVSGAWNKVGSQKAIRLQSQDELIEKYRQISSVTKTVLVQEYIEGPDNDIVVFCCYIAKSGKLFAHFTARKLCQNPPLFGTGCLVQAAEIPEIMEPALKILQATGYHGIAEVEFKYDRQTDTYFLIEINTRHWDQHQLGRLVGINLTLVAYQAALGEPIEPQLPQYPKSFPVKWIAERELVWFYLRYRLSRVFAKRKCQVASFSQHDESLMNLIKRMPIEIVCLLKGHTVFGVLHWRDPIPGILLLLSLFAELIKSICQFLRDVVTKKIFPSIFHHKFRGIK